MFQSFAAVEDLPQPFGSALQQGVQRRAAVECRGRGLLEAGGNIGRNAFGGVCRAPFAHGGTDGSGGREPAAEGSIRMPAAPAPNGQKGGGAAAGKERLRIFDPQRIVGRAQKQRRRLRRGVRQRFAARLQKAHARSQPAAERRAEGGVFLFGGAGGGKKVVRAPAFTPEGERGKIGQGGEQAHSARGKDLGGRGGKEDGQLDDGVRPRQNGVAGPCIAPEQRRFAPLGEAAAHHADDGVAAAACTRLLQQVGVPVMKGIVFANYAANFHFF